MQEENPFLKTVKQAAEAKLAAEILGSSANDKDHQDGFSVKILQSAMDNTAGLVKQANDMADRKDKEATQVRAEAALAQEKLFSLMFGEMSRTSNDLRATIEKIDKGTTAPKDSMSTLKEALALVTILKQEFGLGAQSVASQPAGESAGSIEIKRMQMDHEKQMKQLDIQLAQMNQELQFKLLEFNDKKVQRKEELDASNAFRGNALTTISDIAAAAAAGLKGKMGDVGSQAGGGEQAGHGGDPEIKAYVSSFPCQSCGERVAVPNEGYTATCPSCKVSYDLDRTPGPVSSPPETPTVQKKSFNV